MSDLATAGAPHRPNFTSRERREVVVQHERLCRLARFIDAIEALHIVGSAERDGDERLSLTASEE